MGILRYVAGAVAAVGLFVAGSTATTELRAPSVRVEQEVVVPIPVSGLTADGRDFNAFVDGKGKQLDIATVAPLFGNPWENADIRERKPLVYCQEETGEQVKSVVRELLSFVSTRYAGIDFIEESCTGSTLYRFGGTADRDCGQPGVVGCASYFGLRSFRISHNADGLRDGWCRIGCVRAGLAHEIGHWFNLDHTTCDNPEPTTMSAIFVPDGPACGSRGAPDFSWPDWTLTEAYYNLKLRGQSVTAAVKLQVWIELDRLPPGIPCSTPSGFWCILTSDANIPVAFLPQRPWVVPIVDRAGVIEFGPFWEVGPTSTASEDWCWDC